MAVAECTIAKRTELVKGEWTLRTIIDRQKDNTETGITFIKEDGTEEYCSYQALYTEASKMLACMQAAGIKKQTHILTQLEEEKDLIILIWACILGNMVLVPLSTVEKEEDSFRLQNVSEMLEQPYIITRDKFVEKNKAYYEKAVKNRIVCIDDYSQYAECAVLPEVPKESDLAMIMYTSGSTGNPKGVMVTQLNLAVQIVDAAERYERPGLENRYMNFMPLVHMLGYCRHFMPVLTGEMQYMMALKLFMENPVLWMEKVNEYRATALCAPNFSLKFFTAAFLAQKRKVDWDLSCIAYVSCIAEPISREVVEQFLNRLEPYGLDRTCLTPMYGMTESTCWMTSQKTEEEYKWYCLDRRYLGPGDRIRETEEEDGNGVSIVSVGLAVSTCEVRVRLQGKDVEDRTIGIIEFRGEAMTSGYYKNEEANAQTFTDDGWLISGDMGFLDQGHIILTGRAKDMLIVNGQNYYANDIERVAMEVEELENCAVFSIGEDGTEDEKTVLCAKYSGDKKSFEALSTKILRQVQKKAGLTLSHIIPVEDIITTPSGKIQRAKMKAEYLKKMKQLAGKKTEPNKFDAPRTEMEKRIAAVWSEILQIEKIGREDDFYRLGGNSLHMNFIVAHLRDEGIRVNVKYFMEHPTVMELAKKAESKEQAADVKDIPFGEVVPLPNRELLGGRDGMHDVDHWNIGRLFEVCPVPTRSQMDQIVRYIMNYHDGLRMVIQREGSTCRQYIRKEVKELPITYLDFSKVQLENIEKTIDEQVDWFQNHSTLRDNPVHFAVMDFGEGRPGRILLLAHHGIVDGYSIELFQSDFITVYQQVMNQEKPSLPEKTTSLRRWSEIIKEYAKTKEVEDELEQWMMPVGKVKSIPVDHEGELVHNYFKYERVLEDTLLSAKETEMLFHGVLNQDIEINDVLVTALLRGIEKWSGNKQALLDYTFNGRYPIDETVNLSRTIGWIAFLAPLFFEFEDKESQMDVFHYTRKRIRSVRNGGLGYGCLRRMSDKKEITEAMAKIPFPEIMYNFYKFDYDDPAVQGEWGYLKMAKESAGQNEGDLITRGRLIDFVGILKEDQLCCKIQYCNVIHEKKTIQKLYEYVKEELQSLLYVLWNERNKEE